MRFPLALLTLASLPFAAHASFDLMIIYDSNNNKFDRYDPTNGAYLGQFGSANINVSRMQAVSGLNTVFALSYGNYLARYNYSTGQYLGTQLLPSGTVDFAISPDGAKVYSITANGVVNYNAVGSSGYSTMTGTVPTNSDAMAFYGSSQIVTSKLATKSFTLSQISGTSISTVASAASMSSGATQALNISILTSSIGNDAIIQAETTNSCTKVAVGPTFLGAASSLGYGNFSSIVATASGHTGYFYLAGAGTSGTSLVQSYSDTFSQLYSFAPTQVTTIGAMAVAIAPEPQPYLAIGLGSLVLLRRRRR